MKRYPGHKPRSDRKPRGLHKRPGSEPAAACAVKLEMTTREACIIGPGVRECFPIAPGGLHRNAAMAALRKAQAACPSSLHSAAEPPHNVKGDGAVHRNRR